MSASFDSAVWILPPQLRDILLSVDIGKKRQIREIRLRIDAPVMLITKSGCEFLTKSGKVSSLFADGMLKASRCDVEQTFLKLCNYSVHSFEKEISEGFVTYKGNRVGICGALSGGRISSVTSLNIRIARSFIGISDGVCKEVFGKGACSVIVAGPPVSGKTTFLRDMARWLSEGVGGTYYQTAVIDTRREIALPNELRLCDIFSGIERSEGILNAVRSLSPQMIICDEMSTAADITAVSHGFATGVHFVLSIHASDKMELLERQIFSSLRESEQFSYVVFPDSGQPLVYKMKEMI